MCIIKILIDKGSEPGHSTGGARMHVLRSTWWLEEQQKWKAWGEREEPTAFIDRGYLLSVTLLNKRAVDAWGTFSQHHRHFPASVFDFIFITGLLSESLVQPSPLSKTVLIQSEKGGWKNHSGPSHPAHSLCVTVWSTLQSSEHQNYQTQEQYEMCQHHESVEKNIYIKYRGRFIYLLDK